MKLPATITERASLTISLKNDEVLRAKYLIAHCPRVSRIFFKIHNYQRSIINL
jgi:hypothetical protein